MEKGKEQRASSQRGGDGVEQHLRTERMVLKCQHRTNIPSLLLDYLQCLFQTSFQFGVCWFLLTSPAQGGRHFSPEVLFHLHSNRCT